MTDAPDPAPHPALHAPRDHRRDTELTLRRKREQHFRHLKSIFRRVTDEELAELTKGQAVKTTRRDLLAGGAALLLLGPSLRSLPSWSGRAVNVSVPGLGVYISNGEFPHPLSVLAELAKPGRWIETKLIAGPVWHATGVTPRDQLWTKSDSGWTVDVKTTSRLEGRVERA